MQYLRLKQQEAEERAARELAERVAREEAERLAREEAARLEAELAVQRAAHEARLHFLRGLQLEQVGLERTISINPAFVWSYFDLLQWLGLEQLSV